MTANETDEFEFKTEASRVWLEDAEGRLLAEVDFPALDAKTVDINHTFVDDSLRGRGVAGRLMEAVAAELRRTGKKARLSCSYAAGWFPRHPEFADVVA